MSIKKWTEFTAADSIASDDLIALVVNPGDNPATRKATVEQLFEAVTIDASQITSGTIDDARIPAAIARDSELTAGLATKENAGIAATLIADHENELDPHPQYAKETDLGTAAYQASSYLLSRTNHTGTQAISTVADLQTTLDGKQSDLGFTPLNPANNLSDLANTATARNNLSLGTAATQNTSAFATAAQGATADSALQPSAINSTIQAYDSDLAAIAALTPTNGQALIRGVSAWEARSLSSSDIPDISATYQVRTEKASANGYASLDSTTLIPGNQMGSSFASIPAGQEAWWFVDGNRQWRDRSTLLLPEQTSVTTPSADQVRLYAVDENGVTVLNYLDSAGFVARPMRDTLIVARNSTGATLTKGTVVYVNGAFSGSGILPTIAKAQANSRNTLPAIGVVAADIANNSIGRVLTEGRLDGIDTATSGATDGQRVLVSATTAGAFTATAPSLPNHTQRLGVVIRSHASQGAILIDPQSVITGVLGTDNNTFSVGDATDSTKTLRFLADFNGDLSWNPSAARVLTLPDATGTLLDTTSYARVAEIQSGFSAADVGSILRKNAAGTAIEYAVPRCRVLYRWGGNETITGTIAETGFVNGLYIIPANTLSSTSTLEISASFSNSSSANSKTSRFKIGSTTFYSNAVTTTQSLYVIRQMMLTALNSQITGSLAMIGPGTSNTAIQATSFDFSQAQTFQVFGQLADTADTFSLRSLEIRDFRQ